MATPYTQDYIFTNQQYAVDTAAALSAALFASPIVLSVDKALAQAASGTAALIPSFVSSIKSLVTKPNAFFTQPAFKWVYLIYSASYLSSNYSKTACNQCEVDPSFISWAVTSMVNASSCILKDYKFAQLFGTVNKPVPPKSLLIWLARDGITMYSVLSIPPIVSKEIQRSLNGQISERQSNWISQFFTPLLFQFILTPIHIWGYDVYNNPSHTSKETVKFILKDLHKAVGLRMIRCLAPWSIGQSINLDLRTSFAYYKPMSPKPHSVLLD